MNPGDHVRERITGRAGVVLEQLDDERKHLVLFSSLKGHQRVDGSTDNGLRRIPRRLLFLISPPIEDANVLQAGRQEIQSKDREESRPSGQVPHVRPEI